MRKIIASAVVLVAALALTVPGAIGGPGQTPGVTAKTITIGGLFPLTGPAASYAPIPLGMKAYFAYINARRGPDGKRGVMGRQIIWKYYDDAYNPATSAQLSRRLVEQDKVFATVGQLGTEPISRLSRVHEPAEGAAGTRLDGRVELGAAVQGVPVDDRLAARLHRRGPPLWPPHQGRIQRGKKIAIVYQNDDYGKDYLYGFRAALGKAYADANVVAQEAVETTATSVASQMVRIRASGATVLRDLPASDADGSDDCDGQGARI